MDCNGVITYCNPNHAKIFGYSPEEMVGRSMLDLIAHDADRERTRRLLAELVRDRPTPWTLETQNRTKDGRVIWLRIDWNYRLNESGEVVGFVSVLTDVTARKRAEAERQAIEAQIQQSQKLESLGVLAGGIAHDFNNLLMVVLGHAEMILTDHTLSEQVRGNLADIEKAAQRASELCRQLLAYSGRGRFVIKPVDLNALIQELGRLLEVSIGKNAQVEYRLAEQILPVLADATQLRQVVLNLLTNAAEAMPASDGRITVTTACRHVEEAELEGMVLGQALEAGTYISLEVADTGCGMDPDTVARMFDPFFTTKFTGRGLGLAAVMGIVRSHNGAIACRSRRGAGTTIEVLLPALTGPYSSLSDTGPLGVRTWHGQGLVLLADDDPQVRTVSRQMLEKLGLQVIAAADGVGAVELFRARSGEFACVLLDLMMPRLSVEEVLETIRQIAPAVPVVLMSGYSDEETARRFVGHNRLWFLQKPFKIKNISNIFREFMPEATSPNAAS
ncbi:MAG: PAS domain S-box protein [Acidobacteria bacterium]|nr:PAS domain S-box protein [Acidobacteriota bacterium]